MARSWRTRPSMAKAEAAEDVGRCSGKDEAVGGCCMLQGCLASLAGEERERMCYGCGAREVGRGPDQGGCGGGQLQCGTHGRRSRWQGLA